MNRGRWSDDGVMFCWQVGLVTSEMSAGSLSG